METGANAPLGATADADGVNFALFSSVAERVELCLFDEHGRETGRYSLPQKTGDVWHGYLPNCRPGQRYGYRVHGGYEPERGLRCNPAKLLIDPYARLIDGEFVWHDAVFDYRRNSNSNSNSNSNFDPDPDPDSNSDPRLLLINELDSAPFVPKSVVCAEHSSSPKPGRRTPWTETIFYEANVRGYTMRHPAVEETARGTFAGMRNGEVLAYLKALGITSLELLPVQAFIDERHLTDLGLRNYWGYNTIGFFSPMPRYARGDAVAEFVEMVNAVHDAGLELIMDVVYNHTAEGNRCGPTLSFRGIDNAAYYRCKLGEPGRYVNDTGTGNTLNADHSRARQLVIDSLRYWANDMGVDGFRFDLATVLGRHAEGFSNRHPLLEAIGEDTQLRHVKLIAEPWDIGPGGYQLGGFPPRWAEWNDRFRDTARRFWCGDENVSGELAGRLHGSADLFDAHDKPPFSSVNLITAHDGFTLNDVVSYERRHNEANGENNRDGHSHNYSCNHGIEGTTDDEQILEQRRKHRLNLLATLFFSQGTPMLLAGDEFGNSQAGNNNAYAQDNETGWIDWSGLSTDPAFTEQVRELIWLRRELPLLRQQSYVHGKTDNGFSIIDLKWLHPQGSTMQSNDWEGRQVFGVAFQETGSSGETSIAVVLLNGSGEDVRFHLPALSYGQVWRVAFSTDDAIRQTGRGRLKLPAFSVALALNDSG